MKTLTRKLASYQFPLRGLATVLKEESGMRAHFLWLAIVFSIGYFIGFPRSDMFFVVFSGVCWACLELLNSSIERAMNLVHPEINFNVKKIKDIAAGSSLLMGFFHLGFFIYLLVKSF